jgi:D-psicose/D-tagatose/L-ribulose 3-epimerase
MKFGINTWVWVSPLTNSAFENIAKNIVEMGYDWVEVPVENPNDIDYAPAAKVIRDYGLGVSVCAAMAPDRDLIHSDPQIRDSGVAYLKHCIDATHTLGGTNLVGPMYSAVGRVWQSTPQEREQDIELLVKQLRALADYATDKGVVLGVEPLNRFETSLINLASQVIEVVDRVSHPACKVMLDTFHMNIEERSLGDAIRAAGSRLCHVHTCENDRGAPGSGHVPWPEVAQALRDINYDGPLVIESFTSQVKSIARAAAIWRSFAPTQDDLAKDGLRYLKQLVA